MKLFVCVKQVTVLGDEVAFSPDGLDIDFSYADHALNEWDAYATEEALQVRERVGGGEVVVATVGASDAEETLRRCLAMGADRAIRIDGELLDPFSVARSLATVIGPEKPDLVFCGVQSSDSVQGSTGSSLAELLGLPSVAVVTRLEWSGQGRATVHRELEGGLIDVVEVETPAVVTIQTGINKPRYASLRAIKEAERRQISVAPAAVDGQASYQVRRMLLPSRGQTARMIAGSPAEISLQIAGIVRERLR